MMEESRRARTTEEARELQLAPGGCEEIVTANHQRDALDVVVHGRRELICPVAVAILDQQVATLLRRILRLWAVAQVDEALDHGGKAHADTEPWRFGQMPVGAGARVAQL